MKIHVASDLHVEFAPYTPPPTTADVVVLAGDVEVKRRDVKWATRAFEGRPVVMVGGNHTSYGDSLPNSTVALKTDAESSGCVHYLENDAVVIDGVRFLGCTLWTDCRYHPDGNLQIPDYATPEHWMTDYRRIRVAPNFRKLRARDTAAIHAASVKWLRDELSRPFDGKTVVVTHHAPSDLSVLHDDRHSDVAMAYVSRLDDLVKASGAAVWVHGHTHVSVDYPIGGTRVLANQRGYPDQSTGFDPELIVTL